MDPEEVLALRSAPQHNSGHTMASCPYIAARCSAVKSGATCTGNAPLCNSSRTMASCPPFTAHISAVIPLSSLLFRSYMRFTLLCNPFLRSRFSTRGWMSKHEAKCNSGNGFRGTQSPSAAQYDFSHDSRI